MRRFVIRLALGLALVLVLAQFALPAYLASRIEKRLTEHGGRAHVTLRAFPAERLLFGHGDRLEITASGLGVDLDPKQQDVFRRLDHFSDVQIDVRASRAGPFTISAYSVKRLADHTYAITTTGDGTAGDVARYAGSRLAGGFGQALAGLAASALGNFDRPIPFDAGMKVDTSGINPRAYAVVGDVAGFPAGPLAQVVANALLRGV
jgi:hypothetical protein